MVELTERDAHFVSANALCDTFFGVASGKLEGTTLRAAPGRTARDGEDLDGTVPRLPRDRPARSVRVPRYRPKQPVWVAVTLSPMDSLEPTRDLCSFIVEDITDRKHTEAELVDAKEVAEAASQAKDRFLAVLEP